MKLKICPPGPKGCGPFEKRGPDHLVDLFLGNSELKSTATLVTFFN